MSTIDQPEPSAGAIVADRTAALTRRLDAYAGGIVERFDGFGAARELGEGSLLATLNDRWAVPDRLEDGLELFDLDAVADMARSWSSRPGYIDAMYGFEAPYVVPVEPLTARILDAGEARAARPRGRRRPPPPAAPRRVVSPSARPPAESVVATPIEAPFDTPVEAPIGATAPFTPPAARRAARALGSVASRTLLRPVVPSPAAPAPAEPDGPLDAPAESAAAAPVVPAAAQVEPVAARPARRAVAPRARERWRAVDAQTLSPYPAAMGRAGAVQTGLLRFPDARAVIGGPRNGVVVGPPGLDLMPDGDGLVPAARGARRMVDDLVERLSPSPARPVAGWLVPDGATGEDMMSIPRSAARTGTWRGLADGARALALPGAAPISADPSPLAGRLDQMAEAIQTRLSGPAVGAPRPMMADGQPGALVEPTAADGPISDADVAASPTAAAAAADRRAPAPTPSSPAAALVTHAASVSADERAAEPAPTAPALDAATSSPAAVSSVADPSAASVERATAPPREPAAAPRAGAPRPVRPGALGFEAQAFADAALAAPAGLDVSALIGAGPAAERLDPVTRIARAAGARFDAGSMALVEPAAPVGARPVVGEPAAPPRSIAAPASPAPRAAAPDRATAPAAPVAPAAAPAPGAPIAASASPVRRPLDPVAERGPAPAAPPSIASAALQWMREVVSGRSPTPPGPAPDALPGARGLLTAQLADRLAAQVGVEPLRSPFEAATMAAAAPTIGLGVDRLAAPAAVRTLSEQPADRALVAPVADAVGEEPAAEASTGAPAAVDVPGQTPLETVTVSAPPAADGPTAGTAEPAAIRADAPAVADPVAHVEPTQPAPVSTEAPSEGIEPSSPADRAAGQVGRAAARWSAWIGARLEGAPGTSPAVVATVARRIEQGLTSARGPALLSALRRLESATEVEAGRSAWRSVVAEAGLEGPELVAPIADRVLAPTSDAPSTPAAPRVAARQPSAPVTPPTPTRFTASGRPVPADAPRPSPTAIADTVFERRMGRSTAFSGPAAAPRRWVLDPTGRSWVVPAVARGAEPAATPAEPIGAAGRAMAPAAEPSATRSLAAEPARARAAAFVERRRVAVQSLAERIAAAVLAGPAPRRRAVEALGESGALVQPAASVSSAVVTAAEQATIAAMASPQTTGSTTGAAGRPGAVGARSVALASRVSDRPTTLAARAVARAGGTPGELTGASPASSATAATRPAGSTASRRAASPSAMDPMALLEAGTSAPAARLPDRLARLWTAATAPEADGEPTARAFAEAGAARVVVAPPDEPRAERVSSGSTASAGPLGGRGDAAMRAFQRVRASSGSSAPAVGRATVPTDVGALLVTAGADAMSGQLFGDRGPLTVTPPAGSRRVLIETGAQVAGAEPLRSTGDGPAPAVEKNEEARHRNADQIEGDMSPEELEELAEHVLDTLRREMEFDGMRFGEDEWD